MYSSNVFYNIFLSILRGRMNSNDQKSALMGCCIIYFCLAAIIYTSAVLLGIRASLEAQGELLFLRDIVNYFVGPLIFLSLIIAPVIGATIIAYQTKEMSIGIRSIKYFFIPILILNIVIILDSLSELLFNPDPNTIGHFLQGFGLGMFVFLQIAVLISRFISIILLTRLLRTNYFFTVRDGSEYTR